MTVPNPVPIFDGKREVVPPDEHAKRIADGVRAGVLNGERRQLDAQVRALERTLPATPRRNRAAGPASRHSASLRPLSAAEEAFVNPHRHLATGARNSAADLALIQKAHDALSRLGATCRDGSADDGNADPPLAEVYHPDAGAN